MKRRRLLELGWAAALAAPAARAGVVHTERSLYRDVIVRDDGGLRCMVFARQRVTRQTCVSLAEPQRLVLEYTRMLLAALYLQPAPRRLLLVGLGGGALPGALQRLLPAAQIDVVELDPAVIRAASSHFGFVPGPRTRVREGDGRVHVKRALKAGERHDLVVLDAYDHEYIPEHLLTREFLAEVARLLAPGGVVAANTFTSSRLELHETATWHSVWGDFYELRRQNRIILVREGGLPSEADLARNARALDPQLAPLAAASDWLLPLFTRRLSAESHGVRVLTDQYAPSNLLNGR